MKEEEEEEEENSAPKRNIPHTTQQSLGRAKEDNHLLWSKTFFSLSKQLTN